MRVGIWRLNMKKFHFLLVILILLSACSANGEAPIQASGLIEATEVSIAPEISGRVIEVLAGEGDAAQAGDPLLVMDDSLLLAEMRTFEASLEAANANVNAAQSAFDLAQLEYDQILSAALSVESETRVAIWKQSKPGEFDQPTWYFDREERLSAVHGELVAARESLEKEQERLDGLQKRVENASFLEAEVTLSQARIAFENAKDVLDRTSGSTGPELRDAAQTAFDDAKLDLEDAQDEYDDALTGDDADDLLEARARVFVARERYDMAMDAIRAFETGANAPEVAMAAKAVEQANTLLAAARSSVKQSQAQLLLVETQMEKLIVRSPLDGVILVRSVQPGEVIQAGMTAMTVAQLDTLTITVYLSEHRYGEVRLGDQATLSVDSFPDETFIAVVTRIADQAEYTPRNVQTKEERQTTVYAVELVVENLDHRLKPGMPADVVFPLAGDE